MDKFNNQGFTEDRFNSLNGASDINTIYNWLYTGFSVSIP